MNNIEMILSINKTFSVLSEERPKRHSIIHPTTLFLMIISSSKLRPKFYFKTYNAGTEIGIKRITPTHRSFDAHSTRHLSLSILLSSETSNYPNCHNQRKSLPPFGLLLLLRTQSAIANPQHKKSLIVLRLLVCSVISVSPSFCTITRWCKTH